MNNAEKLKVSIEPIFRISQSKENRSVTDANKSGTIYLRVKIINQKPIEISSKIKCYRKQWDSKKGRLKGRDEHNRSRNYQLEGQENKLRSLYTDLLNKNEEFDLVDLKEIVSGEYDNRNDVINSFKDLHELNRGKYAKTTNSHYTTTTNYLVEFIQEQFNLDRFPVSKVNYSFINKFDNWLRLKRNCEDTGASKHHIRIKKLFNELIKEEKVLKNPYVKFKITRPKSKPKFLVQAELDRIKDLDLGKNEPLQEIRDTFLFACYTGLSHVEVRQLKRNCIYDIDGYDMIVAERQKSKQDFTVMLLDEAKELLDKYSEHLYVLVNDTLMPTISNQKTNKHLKQIQELAKIDKNLTFHMARHTFATTIVLQNGGTTDSLKGMLGHADVKTTQVYGRIVDTLIQLDMNRVKRSLNARKG